MNIFRRLFYVVKKNKSYLYRIIDMLHMGKINKAIFGKEVLKAILRITKEWTNSLKSS